jgi:hypothetical protein
LGTILSGTRGYSAAPTGRSRAKKNRVGLSRSPRQGGGHWFEPSIAHLTKAPLRRGFLLPNAAARREGLRVVEAFWKHLALRLPIARRELDPDGRPSSQHRRRETLTGDRLVARDLRLTPPRRVLRRLPRCRRHGAAGGSCPTRARGRGTRPAARRHLMVARRTRRGDCVVVSEVAPSDWSRVRVRRPRTRRPGANSRR